jgi:hypothetical protein
MLNIAAFIAGIVLSVVLHVQFRLPLGRSVLIGAGFYIAVVIAAVLVDTVA